MKRLSTIITVIRDNALLWWTITLGGVSLYYSLLLISAMVRFGQLPNYINIYDWWGNVIRILQSTPSMHDSLSIIKDEWLLEVGYMNYDFGMGISEWSLFLVPIKVLGVAALGALVATNFLLLRRRKQCQPFSSSLAAGASGTATGLGAGLVSLTSISLSWVVCCSTPNWVVGLAMLGLGVSTSLWLEPLGTWINALGFILLLSACFWVAGRIPRPENDWEKIR